MFSGYDDKGNIRIFDLWCIFAGWDGGTIHDALEYFREMPVNDRQRFLDMVEEHRENGQLVDDGAGWVEYFIKHHYYPVQALFLSEFKRARA